MNFNIILFFFICILSLFIFAEKIFKKFFKTIFLLESNIFFVWCKRILPVIFVVFFVRVFLYEPYVIPTGSMKPTILEGDFIFVNKHFYGIDLPFFKKKFISSNKPKRGDVVVFKHLSGNNYVKRIIGISGDHITYKNNFVYVNNLPVNFKYNNKEIEDVKNRVCLFKEKFLDFNYFVYKSLFTKNNNYNYIDVVVPKNCYFVLGDNRDNSNDSRYWGFICDNSIIGKVSCIWLSVDFNNLNIRYRRFFNKL